jgi:hypothetical protein
MWHAVASYSRDLIQAWGQGWNRFWYTPSPTSTLGLLRLLAGFLALYNLASYTPDLERFFGPQGMLPVDTVRQLNGAPEPTSPNQPELIRPRARWSYLDYAHPTGMLWTAHAASLLATAAFACGLWTRITGWLALVAMLSYFHRAPMLTSEFEPVLAFLLFYLALGPSGASWSLDGWLARRRNRTWAAEQAAPPAARWSATVATRLLQLHYALVCLMMAFGQLYSLESDAWLNGSAMWYIAVRPESALVDFTWLRGHVYTVNFWTHAVVLYELAAPILLWVRRARPLLLALGALHWLLLGLASGLDAFAAAMLTASLAFLPPEWLQCPRAV